MTLPLRDSLPVCAPGDLVAVGGARDAAPSEEDLARRYERLGARVVSLASGERGIELAILASANNEQVTAGQRLLAPGGTMAITGYLRRDAWLPAPDCVLTELEILFPRDDAS
jgi:threonine dehydrogenase-like Zn-dependent dehydrogenase